MVADSLKGFTLRLHRQKLSYAWATLQALCRGAETRSQSSSSIARLIIWHGAGGCLI